MMVEREDNKQNAHLPVRKPALNRQICEWGLVWRGRECNVSGLRGTWMRAGRKHLPQTHSQHHSVYKYIYIYMSLSLYLSLFLSVRENLLMIPITIILMEIIIIMTVRIIIVLILFVFMTLFILYAYSMWRFVSDSVL